MSRVLSSLPGLRCRPARPLVATLAIAGVALVPLLGAMPAANAAAGSDLAAAVMADPALITGASISAPSPLSNAVATTPLAGFPTAGSSFAILSSGKALDAYNANTSTGTTTNFAGPSRGSGNDRDVTVLKVDVNVPAGDNCLQGVDFRFLSEEFPEFVGDVYNDAFIAEVDSSTWTASGSTINAPNNFAFDSSHNVISINASGAASMTADGAAGTTYDGGTGILTAATPITPGAHSLYFSIFDQGDNSYDSTVLIDNIRFGAVANVSTDCQSGAAAAPDVPVSAVAPTKVDESGTADDTYTIASTTGVKYLVGGVVKAAGTYAGSGTVTVTAEAESGYTLTGPASFDVTFSAAVVQPTEVAAVAPTKVDESGTADDTYTIASTTGVKYLVGGVVKAAGTYAGSGTVTVTAEAESGYTLTGPASFDVTFSAAVVQPTEVAAVAPTKVDESGTADDTYTIASTTGVKYLVGGVVKAAGTYAGSGTVTVTAEAESGYTLTGPASFDVTFSAAVVQPTEVAAVAPTKVDVYGTTNDTYTIASTTGVKYLVGGVVKAAGTYPGSGTVTVTAEAETGYTLTGPASFDVAFTATKATALTSTGTGTATHTVHPTVPGGTQLRLLTSGAQPTSSITVPGEGSYVVEGNSIVFTPVLGFSGIGEGVTYQIVDGDGNSQASYIPTVTKPAGPTPQPKTSTGAGTTTQTVAVNRPTSGSVTLRNTSDSDVTVLTVPGTGTYTVDPSTGAISFVPEGGFSGQAPVVTYAVTDAYGTVGTSTYRPTVTTPAAPDPAPATSTGSANTAQQVNITVPPGGTVQLVGPGQDLVDQVVVANQGTYTVNPTTGVITFTPVRGFVGLVDPITYVVTDSYQQTGRATYAAQVAQVTAPRPGLVVRDHVRSASSVPVSCNLTVQNASGCSVGAFAYLNGQRTLIGTGVTNGANSRNVAVRVVLNRVGRGLASRPGGVRLQLIATVRSGGAAFQTSGKTQVVAAKVVLRTIYFGTNRSKVSRVDRAYLRGVRGQLGSATKATCTGYADARSSVVYNAKLGKARAKAVCRVLTRGMSISHQMLSRGEKRPAASNATSRGRSLNRRVVVTLTY